MCSFKYAFDEKPFEQTLQILWIFCLWSVRCDWLSKFSELNSHLCNSHSSLLLWRVALDPPKSSVWYSKLSVVIPSSVWPTKPLIRSPKSLVWSSKPPVVWPSKSSVWPSKPLIRPPKPFVEWLSRWNSKPIFEKNTRLQWGQFETLVDIFQSWTVCTKHKYFQLTNDLALYLQQHVLSSWGQIKN